MPDAEWQDAEDRAARLEREIERLRERTHQIQIEESRRHAERQREIDSLRNAYRVARNAVADIKADWTTDPPSQERYGFWRYTSNATSDALMRLAYALVQCAEAAGADMSDGPPDEPTIDEWALAEVKQLREEYDELLEDAQGS